MANHFFPVHVQPLQGRLYHVQRIVIPQELSDTAAHGIAVMVHIFFTPFRNGPGAAPPAVRPLGGGLDPADKAAAAAAAADLSGEKMRIGMNFPAIGVLVVLIQPSLGLFPQFPVYNWLMVISQDDLLHLPVVGLFLVGQIVRGVGFPLDQIAHIFFISQDLDDLLGCPFCGAGEGLVSLLPEPVRQLSCADLLHGIFVKDQPHQLRPIRIYSHFAALHIVAQHGPAEHHTLFHLPLLAPGDTHGGLAALLLGGAAHVSQPQLAVGVLGAEAVAHKIHMDTHAPELPGVGNGVQNVS